MRLKPPEVPVLLDAIESNFDPFSMDQLLETRFSLKLYNITAIYKSFGYQAVDIHRYFDQRNRSEELIAALRDARPRVLEFVTLADRVGFAQLPLADSLEVLVRKGARPYQDVISFRAELSKLEAAVCRVETLDSYGTGSLVGPNIVLTNYHVIASCLDENGGLVGAVSCLFDYRQGASDYITPGLRIAVSAVLAQSPYSQEDRNSEIENADVSKLDYAILKLDCEVASQPVVKGGEARGFIPIAASPRLLRISDGLLVLQHPRAQPMKVDIGAVTWTGKTRLRHSVNTERGSSGSPVFDGTLSLVALHHAGYDWPSSGYPYNQAVPLKLIAADIRAGGIPI